MVRAAPVISIRVTIDASEVVCSIMITSLLYCGSARRRADGSRMRRYRVKRDMPTALAASISPWGVALRLPARISAEKELELKANDRQAQKVALEKYGHITLSRTASNCARP